MIGGYVKITSNCFGLPLGWDAGLTILEELGSFAAAMVRTGEDLRPRRVVGWTDLFGGSPCPVEAYRVRDAEGTEALLLCGGNSGLRVLARDDDEDLRTAVDAHLPNGWGMAIMCVPDEADLIRLISDDEEAITLPDAAKYAGLSHSTMAQAVREGRVEARRVGRGRGTWLTSRAAVDEAIAEGRLRPRKH